MNKIECTHLDGPNCTAPNILEVLQKDLTLQIARARILGHDMATAEANIDPDTGQLCATCLVNKGTADQSECNSRETS